MKKFLMIVGCLSLAAIGREVYGSITDHARTLDHLAEIYPDIPREKLGGVYRRFFLAVLRQKVTFPDNASTEEIDELFDLFLQTQLIK